MKKILNVLLVVYPFLIFGQKTITGKVFDASTNQPLSQANIIVKVEKGGTMADNNGNFALKVSNESKSIVISYVGYESRTVNLEDRTNFSI